jgi:hypothetical protein
MPARLYPALLPDMGQFKRTGFLIGGKRDELERITLIDYGQRKWCFSAKNRVFHSSFNQA